VESRSAKLIDRWPVLARELRAALMDEHEVDLAEQVGELRVVEMCGCDDDFCQSFYTEPRPDGAYPYEAGRRARNVMLEPAWEGYAILDVVDERIAYVEVLSRPPLD
jgi:hypothetical protein